MKFYIALLVILLVVSIVASVIPLPKWLVLTIIAMLLSTFLVRVIITGLGGRKQKDAREREG